MLRERVGRIGPYFMVIIFSAIVAKQRPLNEPSLKRLSSAGICGNARYQSED